MNTREFVIGHHSDIAHDGRSQVQRIDNGHKARGFPKSKLGYYVGYHFVVEEDGSAIKTRELDERGAHADNCGCKTDLSGVGKGLINFRSIGICLAGKFSVDSPTEKQIETFHDLVWSLEESSSSRLLLHREVKNTSCPVIDLRILYLEEHKRWLALDLIKKQAALRWAVGLRRTMLERAIARTLRLLHPSPSSVWK